MPEPTWRLTIDTTDTGILPGGAPNVWVVTGSSTRPVLEILSPPVVVPPPPPVGDPLAPQPGEDTSPFDYPQGGPMHQADHAARQFNLGKTPPHSHWNTNEQGSGNPSPHSLKWAGRCAWAARTSYGKLVEGFDLWVPSVRQQDGITGEWVEVAAPHLIRRALAKGRLA